MEANSTQPYTCPVCAHRRAAYGILTPCPAHADTYTASNGLTL